jgi:hypothetical protein
VNIPERTRGTEPSELQLGRTMPFGDVSSTVDARKKNWDAFVSRALHRTKPMTYLFKACPEACGKQL